MRIHGGYIIIARKLLESPSWQALNEAGKVVMITLLMMANHKPRKWFNPIEKKEVMIERGQCVTGRNSLAKKANVGVRSVRTSLNLLKSTNFLTIKPTKLYSLITILNYNTYQNTKNYTDQVNDQASDPAPTKLRPQTIQLSNVNKEKNTNTVCLFEELWLKYPKRVGKKESARHFQSSVKTDKDRQDIQIALENYLKSDRVSRGYIQNGSTWFNNWTDWVDFKEIKSGQDEYSNLQKQFGLRKG